jgi:predicted NBD/HSP70 family sugar kinase
LVSLKRTEVLCAVALRDGGPMTIAQLAKVTGLSRPTVDAGLTVLTDHGLASVAEESVGGGRDAGRPAKLFYFVARSGVVAGVDVGGHLVRLQLADLAGQIIAVEESEIDPDLGGADALETIYALLDAVLDSTDTRELLRGIAIGVTGIVGADGRVALSYALPAWNSADIAGRVGQRYRCPVTLDNDARMASMAEHHLGASKLADDVVYLQVGHRISTSLLIDGKVHRGRHHASGEAGYLLFDGIATDEASNIVWRTAANAEEVVTLSLQGDAEATAELMAFIEALAPGLAALTLVTDPDLVVIGGGLSRAGTFVITALQAAVNARIRVPAMPTLVQSRLGAEAVVIGAVIRAYEIAAEQVYRASDVPPPQLDVTPILVPTALRIPRTPGGTDRSTPPPEGSGPRSAAPVPTSTSPRKEAR